MHVAILRENHQEKVMNMMLKISLTLVAFVVLVSVTVAGVYNWQAKSEPSSAAITAQESAGVLAAGKSDQELIDKQKICPVSGAPLGSMGAPIKVTVKGRDVFLCCANCKAAFLKDPDKYLAKLDKQGQK